MRKFAVLQLLIGMPCEHGSQKAAKQYKERALRFVAGHGKNSMQVYNTMTRKKEELVPLREKKIGMYVCGPTVYSFIHIGNARPLIVFDTLRRFLRYMGYEVTYVQNFTDIDDKVIKRANEEGITYLDVSDKYIKEFYHDADALNVMHADVAPRATEHIEEIISLVKSLIEKGHAYPTDTGDVYFSVTSFPEYGKLSWQPLEQLEAGASERLDSSTDGKRDPLDFALWKGAKVGEPAWESPWGMGRPGWHIECSAMSMNILGKTFDIHAGGVDLIFPHHENEIAQSEAATGEPFAKYWMHNGHINIDNKKMSKSAGNFFTVRDITNEFEPEVVRLFMLSAHYRSPINFSHDLMEQSKSAYARLKTAKERLENAERSEAPASDEFEFVETLNSFRNDFIAAMNDDLNTADALGVLFDLVRAANTFVSLPRTENAITQTMTLFTELCDVLGILQSAKVEEIPQEAYELLERRNNARKEKNWAEADALRDELREMGYAIEDTKDGAKLKKI